MMTFVNMDSDGLVILPTHRVVHSLDGFDPAAVSRQRREEFFTVEPLPAADAPSYIADAEEPERHGLRRGHRSGRAPAARKA